MKEELQSLHLSQSGGNMNPPVNGVGYAQVTAAEAEPLRVEDLALLLAGLRSTEEVIGRTCKGGRIYNRHPRLVADVNRTGKRFLSCLAAVMAAAETKAR
jgi:hypothetical protein